MNFFSEFSVMNASGPACTTLEELEAIAQSEADMIVMKSCTVEPREGNPEPRYHAFPGGSINSMGLPNLGYTRYIEFSHALKEKYTKPIIASVVGMKPDDFLIIAEAFERDGRADALEINLSCPNVVGKPQIGYDFETSRDILTRITRLKQNCAIGVKLPPYFDFVHYEMMAKILLDLPIDFITCINSVGNTLVLDPETYRPLIKPKGGFGGLGGAIVKPVALANVRKFYELVSEKIQVVGVGGIISGADAYEHVLCGASAVQIGTAYAEEGVDVFGRIKDEIHIVSQARGWETIDDARGKLQEL